MNLKEHMIAVIGLGYVGLPLAVEFGKKRKVIGFDVNASRIIELQAGRDHTLEVSEDELRQSKHLRFTAEPNDLTFKESVVFIVTVPTPVDKANRPNLNPLIKASETVGRLLKPNDLVIYESTVYPGATEEVCVPILESESDLIFNVDFFCGYSPERINPGDKTHRLSDIRKVTSGSTPEVSYALDALYKEIITAGTHRVSSIKVAEAAKVIENSQRDLNIAFVNELSVIFNMMSIDTAEVIEAAATKWNFLPFKPGLVGGHCIGVDPYYLTHKAQELGYQPQVILSGRRINDSMGKYVAQNLIQAMIKNAINVANATVGVMGVTFKENCPDIRNSKVIDIIRELQDWGVRVRAMDPWANVSEVQEAYGLQLTQITADEPVNSIIVAVAHREFSVINLCELRALCGSQQSPVFMDLKALYNKEALEKLGFTVFRL